ncbi:MAG: PEGA domain-containing protein, partial [Syntrophothermus sp.]
GQVWKITITGDKKMDLIPVNIVTDQKGVKLLIDQTERDASKPHMLSSGEHRLIIEKDGFMSVDSIIKVSTANNLFSFMMKEIDLMPVMLKSVPSGARIVIDNSEKGETDKGLFLLPGRHKLRLSKQGYLDIERTIDVNDPVKNEFSFNLSKNEAILKLAVEPADARILINKEDFSGRTEILLNLGKYKIEISKPGYSTVSETFDLNPGDAVTKSYRLTVKTGGFLFSSIPAEVSAALINQNGEIKYEWQGIKAFKDIPTGEYTLVLREKGYKTLRKNITIEEGITKREEIKLELLKPGESDTDTKDSTPELKADSSGGGIAWYYYAGAAVAGGVAAVLTLIKPKAAAETASSTINVVPSRPTGN